MGGGDTGHDNPISLDTQPPLPRKRRLGQKRRKRRKKGILLTKKKARRKGAPDKRSATKHPMPTGRPRKYPPGYHRYSIWLPSQVCSTLELEAERLSNELFCRITAGDIARTLLERFAKAWKPDGQPLVAGQPVDAVAPVAHAEASHIEPELMPPPVQPIDLKWKHLIAGAAQPGNGAGGASAVASSGAVGDGVTWHMPGIQEEAG